MSLLFCVYPIVGTLSYYLYQLGAEAQEARARTKLFSETQLAKLSDLAASVTASVIELVTNPRPNSSPPPRI